MAQALPFQCTLTALGGDSGLKPAPLTLPCFAPVTEQPVVLMYRTARKPPSPFGASQPHAPGGFPDSVMILLLSPPCPGKRSNGLQLAAVLLHPNKAARDGDAAASTSFTPCEPELHSFKWDKYPANPRVARSSPAEGAGPSARTGKAFTHGQDPAHASSTHVWTPQLSVLRDASCKTCPGLCWCQ